MFEAIRSMFAGGALSRYSVEGAKVKRSLYTLSRGRSKKTMQAVWVKVYTPEGVAVERKFDTLYRSEPLAGMLAHMRNKAILSTLECEEGEGKRLEILEGYYEPSLRELMDDGGISAADFSRVVRQVGEGLSYLHGQGLVHRGLCPETIAVGSGGEAKITDLSLVMDAEKSKHGSTMKGVTAYSAPEILRRRSVDARSDVFSLGAIMYEVISGASLFPNSVGFERLVRVMNSKPVELCERNGYVGEELDAVVMKAVANDPKERYGSVAELVEAFEAAGVPERLGGHVPAFAA